MVAATSSSHIRGLRSRILSGLAIALWILLPGRVAGQELPFFHYTPASDYNPLPSAEVNKVYQDRLGYLWFVIFSSGIVRYDGHALESYTVADGLRDLAVWEMIEDRDGRLWVGSNAGLVVSNKPLGAYRPGERIQFVATLDSVPLAETVINRNRLAVDRDGRVWAGTSANGIIRYHVEGRDTDAAVTCDTLATDARGDGKNATVRALVARRDGSVWAGVGGGGLMVFENGATPRVLGPADGFPAQNVNVLYEAPDGMLWGGCRNGVILRVAEYADSTRAIMVSDRLTSNIAGILAAEDSTLWIASEGSGIMRMDPRAPDAASVLTRQNGLLSDNAHHVLLDSEGTLWLAQSGGVSKLRSNYRAFVTYSATSHAGEAPLLPSQAVNIVIPPSRTSNPGALWLGTAEGGIVCLRDDGTRATLNADDGLRNNWVNTLAFDSAGRLWIGTSSGMNCLALDGGPAAPRSPRTQRVTLFGKRGTLSSYRTTSAYVCRVLQLGTGADAAESVWFAGFQNLFCVLNGRWYVLRDHAGLAITAFQSITQSEDGHIWIGTRDQGLYRSITPLTAAAIEQAAREPVPFQAEEGTGTFGAEIMTPLFERVWSRTQGAPTNQIENLLARDGQLWVGTPVGLYVLDTATLKIVRTLTRDDGLGASNVTAMAFSPTGHLWVGTNGGLTEIDPAAGTVLRNVKRQDGLVGNEVWYYGSVAVGEDETVYFGSAQGLSRYSARLDERNPTPPRVRFRALRFLEDSRGNNVLSVEYAALSYSKETRVRYRTRLAGFDPDWSPETAEYKTRYTNLPAFFVPRQYTFEIQACSGDGVWTKQPLSHVFSVNPPVWFRWWAMLAQAGILGAAAITTYKVRTRALKERAELLEAVVETRTAEVRMQARTLADQNVVLEDKNAEILRTQQQLIVQEKLASLGALTAGIAHEIRNPLNFVNNFAQLSGELVEDLRDDISKHKDKLGEDVMRDIDDLLGDLEANMSRINEHGKRANGIVSGMLLHSRGQKGEHQLTRLNGIVEEFAQIAYMGTKASDASVSVMLEKDFDESAGDVELVPQDLSRVIVNLVNNACYAVMERGRKEGAGFTPTIKLITKNLGDKVEIRVRDNGPGIPEKVRESIFTPFFTTKPTGEGTGLGLSISYDIVTQEHGGTITVDSREGEFTEFTVTLPRKRGGRVT